MACAIESKILFIYRNETFRKKKGTKRIALLVARRIAAFSGKIVAETRQFHIYYGVPAPPA